MPELPQGVPNLSGNERRPSAASQRVSLYSQPPDLGGLGCLGNPPKKKRESKPLKWTTARETSTKTGCLCWVTSLIRCRMEKTGMTFGKATGIYSPGWLTHVHVLSLSPFHLCLMRFDRTRWKGCGKRRTCWCSGMRE